MLLRHARRWWPLVVLRRASALAANEQWTKVDVGGKTAKLRVDYFDTPMKQPKAKKGRVADRTGCRPWPVARPLLEHLRTDVIPDLERDLGRPPRVLELGSGVGLLGVGLAMTTDCDVTLTDPDIETNFSDGTSMSTLEWLQRNIELNVASKRARAKRLVWGNTDDARALLRDGGFDLLVGSDLLYDTANYGPLVDSIVSLAPARGAILGYVTRHGAEGDLADLAAARGFAAESAPLVGEGLTKAATATTLTRR